MKIKTDFVTNSSSVSFIVAIEKKLLRKDIEKDFNLHCGEYFKFFKNKRDLIKYTQAKDIDWVTEAMCVPCEYWNLSPDTFKVASEILDDGKFPIYISLNRDKRERKNRLLKLIEKYGGKVTYKSEG